MSNYCALPFAHTTIDTQGTFQLCCWHFTPDKHKVNINSSDYQTWNTNQYLKEVRESFKNDQQHPGCQRCWDIEKLGQPSLRTRSAKDYQLLRFNGTDPLDSPINIEIQLSNLCNLSCLMCHEASSSAILAENRKLGIAKYNQKDFTWSPEAFENLKNLLNTGPKIVNIRGGEPLYNKDLLRIIKELPQDICKKTVLHITTNATTWNNEWKQALSKFSLVRIMLSIDAVGDLYEYIRYPGRWAEVDANVREIQKNTNYKLVINSVVQNLNIGHLKPLLDWSKERDIYVILSQLFIPEYLKYTNLPSDKKEKALTQLEILLKDKHDPHIEQFLINCRDQLLNSNFDQGLWDLFIQHITMRDNIRNNSYTKFL